MVLCSCHFAVLAIVHFHATSLLKSKRVGVIARFPSSNEALEVAEESKDVQTRDLAPRFGVFLCTVTILPLSIKAIIE